MEEAEKTLGPYALVREIGRGSFGVVWLAEKRTSIATTRFALKLPHGTDVDLQALEREAAIWVQASGHPNVLPLIEADVYDGQVVLASEYAPDGSLEEWLHRHGGRAPGVEAACEMVDSVLAGLVHLHELRIIHRDLKPANVLLQRGTPRLADFGISRILRTTSHSAHVAGTFAYMAPEAFDGVRNERTDIWAVGVILFRLLAGCLPYDQRDAASLMAAIINHDPPPLRDTPTALQNVVAKALRRDPALRYASAGAMSHDLREARHHLWLERRASERTLPSLRQLPPHPQPAETATIATAPYPRSLPAGRPATRVAAATNAPARAKRQAGGGARTRPTTRKGWAVLLVGLLLSAAALAAWKHGVWNLLPGADGATYVLQYSLGRRGSFGHAALSSDGRMLAAANREESVQVWNLQTGRLIHRLPAARGSFQTVLFSPDSRWLLASGYPPNDAILLWDTRTGRSRQSFTDHNALLERGAAFSPDSRTLALAAGKTIQLWDVETGELRMTLAGHQNEVNAIALTPDGATLASGGSDGAVMMWNVRTGERIGPLPGHGREVSDVAFSPEGRTLASAGGDGTVKLWEVSTGNMIATLLGHHAGVSVVVYSPDGGTVLSASATEEKGILWDAATGQMRSILADVPWTPFAFSPDGLTLASGNTLDGSAQLWDVRTGTVRQRFEKAEDESNVSTLAFSPDGDLMVTAPRHGVLRLWRRR